VAHLAGNRRPARLEHLPGLRLRLTLGVGDGVVLRFPVVVAALAGVVGVGHRVERPERNVDAVELTQVAHSLERIGREPEAADPARKRIDGIALGDLERQHAFGLDHRLGCLRLVLQMRAAVGTLVGGDLVLQHHHGAAARAGDLRRVIGEGAFCAIAVVQIGIEVVFLQIAVPALDHLLVAAVGTSQGVGRRVEIELGAALRTGKLPARRRGLGDGGFLDFALGSGHRMLSIKWTTDSTDETDSHGSDPC
jgi:hypothetical protein